ncbi:MAG TPA: hypothetical protein VGN26_16600 [Armatimonadota bacterium]|jgi:hypothetical protein
MLLEIALVTTAAATPIAWLLGYLCGYSLGPRTQTALPGRLAVWLRRAREQSAQALILLLIANNLRLRFLDRTSIPGFFLELLVIAAWLGWVGLIGAGWGLRRHRTGEAA